MTDHDLPLEPLGHPLRLTLRVVGMAVLVGLLIAQAPRQPTRALVASLALTGALALSWIGWVIATRLSRRRLFISALFGVSLSGGGLVGLAPLGMAGPPVAGLAGGASLTGWPLILLAMVGPISTFVSVGAAHRPLGYAAGATVAALGGLTAGISRRQYALRAREAAELAAARDRADVERARADILDERNRLARELHDVLAHTLGALAVQLEVVNGLAATAETSEDVRAGLRSSRALVTDGLAEARRAVQALREDPIALVDRLSVLTAEAGAQLEVVGTERPTQPAVRLALLRAAQESLTNARKHASGARLAVMLEFAADAIHLTVTNDGCGSATALATTGTGLGLPGMRERVTLVGGEMQAGPDGDGWRVQVAVPA